MQYALCINFDNNKLFIDTNVHTNTSKHHIFMIYPTYEEAEDNMYRLNGENLHYLVFRRPDRTEYAQPVIGEYYGKAGQYSRCISDHFVQDCSDVELKTLDLS